jgi:histidinol-phosphate phosphatase family protein
LRPAVFFDRDGVVNELEPDPTTGRPESPLDPAAVRLVPGAAEALRRLREAGYLLVGVSNQPAAAKRTVTRATLDAVQRRVLDLLAAEDVVPDDFRTCFHHPEGTDPELARTCDCRKPAPGLLLAAAAELGIDLRSSWMVGDTDADIAAGVAAGCRTILVEHAGSAHKRLGAAAPDAAVPDVLAAATLVVAGTFE